MKQKIKQNIPRGRMSANQCLTHPWIKDYAKNQNKKLISRSKIRRRVIKIRWWKAVDTIAAVNFMRRLSRDRHNAGVPEEQLK